MSRTFHLAIEGGDLSITVPFYTDVLGCGLGPSEQGRYQDIDFWGNELTLHESTPRVSKQDHPERERHEVDMGNVCVPHFGIHLPRYIFDEVKAHIENNVKYLDKPYIRYEGQDTEQETFLVEDPNYNVIEIKTLLNT
jgi:extradiol dioxygenase family protein